MSSEIKKIELIGHIDKNHHLIVDQQLPFAPGDVNIIVFPSNEIVEDDDISTMDILRTAQAGGAFDFLNDPEEDIYTLEDGVPFND
ncbi:MAG: hypothetical protein PF518_18135 [Spirochaetaceae bacterium]|nr:hypothetical protein [Spirochaetaceae bacterium]